MAKKTILDDERYEAFVARYHADPLRFAVEVTDFLPSADQEQLFNAMIDPMARVSVVSGTSTGKTAAMARLMMWHLLCHPVAVYSGKCEVGSNTYLGAPKLAQAADGGWKELNDVRIAIGNGPFAWLNDYVVITKTKVYINGYDSQWFITQIPLGHGDSVGVAGKHRFWQMIVSDESAGTPDSTFDVINGTQTQGGNRTLCLSQGVRNSGFFYETHHRLSKKSGGEWTSLRFNSENSPFATTEWIKQRAIETGGRDTAEYQIRVLGLFPEQADKFLLGRSVIEGRINPVKPVITDEDVWGNLLIVDVAAGVYRDKTVVNHMRVVGSGDRIDEDPRRADTVKIPVYSNALDWTDIVGRVVDYVRMERVSNPTFVVDVGGQGEQFARLLERAGCGNIIRVQWGDTSFKNKNKKRFFNQRAQCSVHAAEAVKDGRIAFTEEHQDDLVNQGARIPFHFDEKARYHIMPKERMKEELGLNSPDLWDTVCMAFLDTVHYIPAERGLQAVDHRTAAAESMFAELDGLIANT